MKPLHEETFHLVPARARADGSFSLVASDGCMVAETRAMGGERIAKALGAGPAMARALLRVRQRMVESGWTHGEEWDAIEEALAEAGVPTPPAG